MNTHTENKNITLKTYSTEGVGHWKNTPTGRGEKASEKEEKNKQFIEIFCLLWDRRSGRWSFFISPQIVVHRPEQRKRRLKFPKGISVERCLLVLIYDQKIWVNGEDLGRMSRQWINIWKISRKSREKFVTTFKFHLKVLQEKVCKLCHNF